MLGFRRTRRLFPSAFLHSANVSDGFFPLLRSRGNGAASGFGSYGRDQHDIHQTASPSGLRAGCRADLRRHADGRACLRAGGDRRADGAAAAARRSDAGAACRLRMGSGPLALGEGRYVWVPGHWQAVRVGYRWVPGHWVAARSQLALGGRPLGMTGSVAALGVVRRARVPQPGRLL